MNRSTATLALALTLLAGCGDSNRSRLPFAPGASRARSRFDLVSTIVFSSTRDDATNPNPALAAEIYLLDPDGTNLRRSTYNASTTVATPLARRQEDRVHQPASPRPTAPEHRRSVRDGHRWRESDLGGPRQLRHLVAGRKGHRVPCIGIGDGLDQARSGAATFDSDICRNVGRRPSGAATRRNITNSSGMRSTTTGLVAGWPEDRLHQPFVSDNQLNS
jgi:hypothetical protein